MPRYNQSAYYNPFNINNTQGPSLNSPFYNPYTGVQHDLPGYDPDGNNVVRPGGGPQNPVAPIVCPPGFILDPATNTCMPDPNAQALVNRDRGDRTDARLQPKPAAEFGEHDWKDFAKDLENPSFVSNLIPESLEALRIDSNLETAAEQLRSGISGETGKKLTESEKLALQSVLATPIAKRGGSFGVLGVVKAVANAITGKSDDPDKNYKRGFISEFIAGDTPQRYGQDQTFGVPLYEQADWQDQLTPFSAALGRSAKVAEEERVSKGLGPDGPGQSTGLINRYLGTGKYEPYHSTDVTHSQVLSGDGTGKEGDFNPSGIGRDFNYDRFGQQRTEMPLGADGKLRPNTYWNSSTGAWTDKTTGVPIGGSINPSQADIAKEAAEAKAFAQRQAAEEKRRNDSQAEAKRKAQAAEAQRQAQIAAQRQAQEEAQRKAQAEAYKAEQERVAQEEARRIQEAADQAAAQAEADRVRREQEAAEAAQQRAQQEQQAIYIREESQRQAALAAAQAADAQAAQKRDRQSSGSRALQASTRAQLDRTQGSSGRTSSGATVNPHTRNRGGLIYRQTGGGVPMMQEPMSFMDRVKEAKMALKGESMPDMMSEPMMSNYDAQGDGPIYGDFQGGVPQEHADMGMDTVDAKLTPGEYVLNQEATEMYRPEIEQMNHNGLIARKMGGPVYRQEGGDVPQSFGQKAHEVLSNPATGRVGEFIYKASTNQPDAIESLRRPDDSKAQQELKSKESRAVALRESIDSASKAKQYIDAGAGKVIDYKAKNWTQLLNADTSWSETFSRGFASISDYVTGEKNAVENAIHTQFANTKEWNAYQLFLQEIRLLELKARALVKGGSISDSESKAAAETIATGKADAATTKQQLDTVIDRNNSSLTTDGFEPYVSKVNVSNPTGEAYVDNDAANNYTLSGAANTAIETGSDLVSDASDAVSGATTTAADILSNNWSYYTGE